MSFYQFMSWFFFFLTAELKYIAQNNNKPFRFFVKEAYRRSRQCYNRDVSVVNDQETFVVPQASLEAMLYITNGNAIKYFVHMYKAGVPAVAAALAANEFTTWSDRGWENYFQVDSRGIFYSTSTWGTHFEITKSGVTIARNKNHSEYGDLGLWKWNACGKLLSASRSDADWRWEDGLNVILPNCSSLEEIEREKAEEEFQEITEKLFLKGQKKYRKAKMEPECLIAIREHKANEKAIAKLKKMNKKLFM